MNSFSSVSTKKLKIYFEHKSLNSGAKEKESLLLIQYREGMNLLFCHYPVDITLLCSVHLKGMAETGDILYFKNT